VTFEDESHTLWQVYDRQGRKITEMDTPKSYWVWDCNSSGEILASYQDPLTDEYYISLLSVNLVQTGGGNNSW